MRMNPMLTCDFYKISHRVQYPKNTTMVYSNFTPRSSKYYRGTSDRVVVFGIQYLIKKMHERFELDFFMRPVTEVIDEYKSVISKALGYEPDVSHIVALKELGYLPIKIKALPEGSVVPYQTPILTICNTHPEFYWLTNFLETWISCELWLMCNNASLARDYRVLVEKYKKETSEDNFDCRIQCHDFSYRGMAGEDAAISSGMAHLTSFTGTDCIPAILGINEYYTYLSDLIGCSVPASEHSVMSAGGLDELAVFKRFITELYPTGIISIVSDTWDFFGVLQNVLPQLKTEIMARDGKVIIRPDSGNPADIVCGAINYDDASTDEIYGKGAIDYLWETFGGHVNDKGYKVLDSHVGIIYGDSITLEVAADILSRLKDKGFASQNIVFGVGSFTYQYNTRDSQGWAVKATYCEIDGKGVNIFKKPKTDSGKNSRKGLLRVEYENGDYVTYDQQTKEQENQGILDIVYVDGILRNQTNIGCIRSMIERTINE